MSLPDVSDSLDDWFGMEHISHIVGRVMVEIESRRPMLFVVPLPPNKANARLNWRMALAAKKAYWKQLDALRLTGRIPKPPVKAPSVARVRSTAFVWSPCDPDNLVARYKPLLDYLKAWGYIVDDGPKHLIFEMPNQDIDRQNQRIEIELSEAA